MRKNCKIIMLIFMLCIAFLCTGCANKLLNELIFTVTDGVYTMETTETEQIDTPSLSFDTHEKTFQFSYDPLSSYFNYGTYIIDKDEVVATTSDGKYTFVFKIVDDNMVSFIADQSDSVDTVEGVTAVPDEAVFKLEATF